MLEDLKLPTARDWMVRSPIRLAPDDDLFDAIDRMVEHGASAVPVLDQQGHLLGMLTEKDCIRVVSAIAYDGDAKDGIVEDFQSPVRVLIEPDMDLFRVAEQFLATNFPVLPVVDGGKLVGQISRQAMLEGIQELRTQVLTRLSQREHQAGRQTDRPRSIESLQRFFANAHNRDQLVSQIGRKR